MTQKDVFVVGDIVEVVVGDDETFNTGIIGTIAQITGVNVSGRGIGESEEDPVYDTALYEGGSVLLWGSEIELKLRPKYILLNWIEDVAFIIQSGTFHIYRSTLGHECGECEKIHPEGKACGIPQEIEEWDYLAQAHVAWKNIQVFNDYVNASRVLGYLKKSELSKLEHDAYRIDVVVK